jgi:hypothetical protein
MVKKKQELKNQYSQKEVESKDILNQSIEICSYFLFALQFYNGSWQGSSIWATFLRIDDNFDVSPIWEMIFIFQLTTEPFNC